MKLRNFFNMAFFAGCLNIPILIVNLYYESWCALISLGAIIVCWVIAFKVACMKENTDRILNEVDDKT